MRLLDRVLGWLRPPRVEAHGASHAPMRGHVDHVIILDGTMSSLCPGQETNAGLTYLLLRDLTPSAHLSVYYEAGIQWKSWRQAKDVMEGRGLNRQIRRAYGFLASRYHPGDRIWLLGYSRGAYAVRSLAGMIDTVGLVRAEHATVRNIVQAYRHYQVGVPDGAAARAFARLYTHGPVAVEMVGVWDTVKALGLALPGMRRYVDPKHAFHNHELGPSVKRGYHALALDETRTAFAPVLWTSRPGWPGEIEQCWFRGAHGDVGGMIDGHAAARPLANIPLVWMLERAEAAGLALPQGWRERFPCDAGAPSIGTWSGVGRLFLNRRARIVGRDPSESIHPSARERYGRRQGGRLAGLVGALTGTLRSPPPSAAPPAGAASRSGASETVAALGALAEAVGDRAAAVRQEPVEPTTLPEDAPAEKATKGVLAEAESQRADFTQAGGEPGTGAANERSHASRLVSASADPTRRARLWPRPPKSGRDAAPMPPVE